MIGPNQPAPRRRGGTSGTALRSQRLARSQRSRRDPRPPAPFAGPPQPAGPGLPAILGPAFRAAGALALKLLQREDVQRCLCAGAILGSLALGSFLVRRQVESWPRYALTRKLDARGLPPELGPRAKADLARLPLPPGTSCFEPRLAGWVHACLSDLPWVAEVERVRLAPPDRVDFTLRPRLPRARLGEGPDAPVVTADGAVIPADYAADPEALPRLLGVPSPQSPAARREALLAGLAVLETLRGSPFPLAAIELSNLDGHADPLASEVVLVGRDGLRVDWGRPPGARPHEDPARLRRALEGFLAARGGLPPVKRVSLRWDQPTYELAPTSISASSLPAGSRR